LRGPYATTAQVEFIVQLLVSLFHRTRARLRKLTAPSHAHTSHRTLQWASILADGNVIFDLAYAGVITFEEDQ
jgi:hypothetical protein